MGFIGFNGKRYEVSRAEYDQLKGKTVDQKLNLLRSWGKEQEAPIVPTITQEQAQAVSEAEKQRKLEWIQAQEAKGAILSPSLKAEIEPVKKQAWIQRQEAKGAILSTTLKARLKPSIQEIPSYEAGKEVSISPAVAQKLGLISKQEQLEAEARGSFFIHRKENVKETPEQTMARLRSGEVIAYKDKSTGEVVFADNLSQVPKGAKIVKSEYFSVENGELKTYSVPASTYFKIKSQEMLKESERFSLMKQFEELSPLQRVIPAIRLGMTNIPDTVDLAIQKVTGDTESYNRILGNIIVKQAHQEKTPLGIIEAEIDSFTKGAGAIALSRPIGHGTQAFLNAVSGSTRLGSYGNAVANAIKLGMGAYGAVSTYQYLEEPIRKKEYGQAIGRVVLIGGMILGAIEGARRAQRLGAGVKPEKAELKPEKVYLKSLRKETPEGNTYRVGQVEIQTEQGNMKAGLMAVKQENGLERFYYDVPEQQVGDVKINHQRIFVEEGDTVKIKIAIDEFTTYEQSTKLGARVQGVEATGENEVELYLKNVKEITNVQPKGDVTAFKRAGSAKGFESWLERGYATPTETVGKGIMAKPAGEFQYFYLEKDITPKVSDLTGFTKPVIRGTTTSGGTIADQSLATSENVVTSALKRLSALRSLEEVKLTGSINTANTGRIIPAIVQAKTAENIADISDRTNKIIQQAVIASTQGFKIKKREVYYVPPVIDSAMIGALQNIERASKQITGSLQGTRQVQTPVQKFIQEIDLITQPETPTRTTTQTRETLRPPRITTPQVPQIERPPRISFPRPFFNVGMGYSSKDLETYLRSIQHSMISAMKLVV